MIFDKVMTTLKRSLINLKNGIITNTIKSFKTCSKYGALNHNRNIYFLPNASYNKNIRSSIGHLSNMSTSLPVSRSNQLVHERSPYLLQHSTNPVNWFPWSAEAINKAKNENKLIFLSVGYSTCHWCHVMERESFENENIASIMNENFVNVKVDREERPDIDKIYMTFVQLVSGSGGWPMSVFLTPDLKPINGGTYFPPEDKYGRPGFKTVLQKISKQWREDPDTVKQTGEKVINMLQKVSAFEVNIVDSLTKGAVPEEECVRVCIHQLSRQFDDQFGGFNIAPKFPQPSITIFLFHFYSRDINGAQNKSALSMALKTLEMMVKGGIHDHIGYGFARYSTDEKWHIPHFEKMLYDQAQLAAAYAIAYLITKKKVFNDTLNNILTYVSRDLSHKDGGFYSAEDADSLPSFEDTEKCEGAFYVWTYDEISSSLSQPLTCDQNILLSDLFSHHYDIRQNGNVSAHNDPHGELLNKNVLIVFGSERETAEKFGITEVEVNKELEIARKILFEERNKRSRPHLDTKIITSWNGLMLSGFAKAAGILQSDDYKTRALRAATFIKTHLWTESNQLLHCCYVDDNRENIVQISNPIFAFLNDYVFLIRGLLDLYDCTYDANWIEWSEQLQDIQDLLFWDSTCKAYNMHSGVDKSVLLHMKDDHDGAEPSGNSVAVQNLLRLSALLDRSDYTKKAEQILSVFTSRLDRSPSSLTEMMCGLMLYYDTPTQIFIAENGNKEIAEEMLKTVHEYYVPNRVLAFVNNDMNSILFRKSETIQNIIQANSKKPSAHVCRKQACSMPVTTIEGLRELLL